MDESQILLLKLDRGRLKENADLIGSLFMAKIKLAAFSHSEIPKAQKTSFCIGVEIAGVALKSCFPKEKRE